MDLNAQKERLIEYLTKSGILRTRAIIEAFGSVPRHLFVADDILKYAYDDIALPIVSESTISQPSTVAAMLELLQPERGERILEIGTGSGWEACLLSRCVGEKGRIVTIEIDPSVERFARSNIRKLGAKNIEVVLGDGSGGYAKDGPYDKIIFAAATPNIEHIVISQLKKGGRIVAPVGGSILQTLRVLTKVSDTKIDTKDYGTFQFIPLRGKYGKN